MNQLEEWVRVQTLLQERVRFPRPKKRQVWWCVIGHNIGTEQSCKKGFERPVLVVGVWGTLFWGVPITSSDTHGKKDTNPLFHILEGLSYINSKGKTAFLHGYVALHQLRSYDSRRLQRKMLKLESYLFDDIMRKLRRML